MGKRKGGKKSKSESGARSRSASKSKDPAVNKTVENKECPPSTEEEIVKKEGKYYYF